MEFLNLEHSSERDSESAQKKENFDNHVLMQTRDKNNFKDKHDKKKNLMAE